jgi:hypothetical protein
MNSLREEILDIKNNIYSANIEKRKLNEKQYTLSEMSKKIDMGYNLYKDLSNKVDNIRSIKDVMKFKNINLKNKISSKKCSTIKKDINYKNDAAPSKEFLSSKELKETFNKLHYNDKTTLEDKKVYMTDECKEMLNKCTTNTNIFLFSALSEDNKYEIESGYCETMLKAYPTIEELRANAKKDGNIIVIELLKNSHYIPVTTCEGNYCALIGGDVTMEYKEKINTGSNTVDIWHIKK